MRRIRATLVLLALVSLSGWPALALSLPSGGEIASSSAGDSSLVSGSWAEMVIAPRVCPVAVYDPVRDRLVVFGGYDGTPCARNDVWVLSLSGKPVWQQLFPSGTLPSGRSQTTAIYDPARDRILIFGGVDSSVTHLNDVWALSLSGTPAWTDLATAGEPPSGRSLHTAVYDPNGDRMIVFGPCPASC